MLPDNGASNGKGWAAPRIETRMHVTALPEAVIVRFRLLGITCAAMCDLTPICRITIVRRVVGRVLIGANTSVVCRAHADKLKESLLAKGATAPLVGPNVGRVGG